MDPQLFSIKINPPPARPDLILRKRLVDRLAEGGRCRLVLISAPPGYGKTSLVAGWMALMASDPASLAGFTWLALDDADNDPLLFFTYLLAAVQRLAPGLVNRTQSLLSSPQLPQVEQLISSLLHDLEGIQNVAFLILDDYHVIRSPVIHQALAFLLDRLPSNLHIVIISREDPPLPLPRLRVRREMVEIREADLRFSLEEAIAFLSQTMHLHLSEEAVTGLLDRTEGWVAGLQMAALALQTMEGKPESQSAESFIAAFRGDDHFVMDYLMDEVFRRQPEEIQNFLLQTSILEQISASLACAVIDLPIEGAGTWRSCQELLETLEQSNLFLIALDHHRDWYRYHHLFVELLRYRLKRDFPMRLPEYHSRAARWYIEKGNPDEAMKHALAAADDNLVATVAEHFGMRLIGAGRLATYLGWLRLIPEAIVFSRPLLCVCCGWAYILTGQAEKSERYVQAGEEYLKNAGPGSAGSEQIVLANQEVAAQEMAAPEVRGHLATIRSYISRRRGDIPAAIEQAHQALSLLPDGARSARCAAALNLGFLHLDCMQYPLAREALLQAVDTAGSSSENVYAAVTALSLLGDISARSGKLHEAERFFQRAIHFGEEEGSSEDTSPARGVVHGWLVWLHLQRHEIIEAQQHLEVVMRAAEQIGTVETQVRACLYQAMLDESKEAYDSAAVWLERVEEKLAGGNLSDLLQTEWIVAKVHSLLARDLPTAGRLLESEGVGYTDLEQVGNTGTLDPALALRLGRYLALAYVLRMQGRVPQAVRLLESIIRLAEALPDMAIRIEALALLSTLRPKNLTYLEQALNFAAPEGYVMPFLRVGGALLQPLLQAIAQGVQPTFAYRLHSELIEQQRKQPTVPFATPGFPREDPEQNPTQAETILAEPLTGREKQVLRLLAAGLSSTAVAKELVISVSTARSYIKNIYAKLDVHNRTEAVEKAVQVGIL